MEHKTVTTSTLLKLGIERSFLYISISICIYILLIIISFVFVHTNKIYKMFYINSTINEEL